MKAIRVNEWGQPVQLEDIPQPEPGENEVLVRVRAASINPVDGGIAAGYMKSMLAVPITLGADFAGDVVAVGEGIDHVKPGDAVYGMSPTYGTFAEYAVVKANGVAHKPRSLDYVDAAAVPLTGLTAWQTLFNLAKLQSGERILINGAGGGIGSFAVQLAKNRGAYVIALDRGDKQALLKELGANEFIDAETQRFEDIIDDVDVVLDLIGGEFVQRSLEVCKPGGRYVTSAAMLPPDAGESQGVKAMGTFTQPTVEELTKLAEEIDAGRLKVYVTRTFPLEQIGDAMAYKQEGRVPGKVAVTIS